MTRTLVQERSFLPAALQQEPLPAASHAQGANQTQLTTTGPLDHYRRPNRSPQIFAWVGDNAKHKPIHHPRDPTRGSYYTIESNLQPTFGQQPSLPGVESRPSLSLDAKRPSSAYERSPKAIPEYPVPENLEDTTRPAPVIEEVSWPKPDPWGEQARTDAILQRSIRVTPRHGWKPWYKHVSPLRGPLGMQQVSPTPNRTPLCSERGEKPKWEWLEKQKEVFDSLDT